MKSNQVKSRERERGLLNAFDRLIIVIAVGLLVVFIVLYFLAPYIPSVNSEILLFIQALLVNLIPVPLLFIVSYATYRRIQSIRDAYDREIFTETLANSLSEKINARETRQTLLDSPPFEQEERVHAAKTLIVIGTSLNTKVNAQFSILLNKLRKGSMIRILLVKPGSQSVPLVAQRKLNNPDPDAMNHYIQLTLSTLGRLKREFPNQVRIHVINYPLAFGALATDIESENGKIFLEYYSFKTEQDGLHLALGTHDTPWYGRFKEQIEELWAFSEAWSYEDKEKSSTETIKSS